MRPIRAVLAAAVASAFALPVLAAPCAGFTDVEDTASFCPAVEWLKNRNITQGCTASQYCPASGVTRASMALFLNRLGTALSPRLSFVEASLGSVDPDQQPTVCASSDVAAVGYPRQALVSVSFGGQSAGDLGYAARPMVSTNSGASWTSLNAVTIRESVTGAAWTNAGATGIYAIPANQVVRFGLGVTRESGGSDFAQARCQVTASVVNANGTSSPF